MLEGHNFRTIDTACVYPLATFAMFVCSDFFFVGFYVFGVSLVVVWCVSAAGGVFRV
jgi:hypothetical protein